MNKLPEKQGGFRRWLSIVPLLLIAAACSHSSVPGSDSGHRMQLMVGDIREVSLPGSVDTTLITSGSSDNAEVADVSPRPSVGSATSTRTTSSIFLIKGVTIGTARIVFTRKRAGDVGEGQVQKVYLVQVRSK